VQRQPQAAAPRPPDAQLLADDLVEAEVLDPGPAVLLGDLHGQHALGRRPGEQLAVDDAVGLPPGLVRGHLLGDEPAHGLAEVDVLGLEQAAAHAGTVA
jgi:hypothetical protein